MKKNDDGSLTLYIQKDSPGADKEANWLPAPDGPIYLVMRLYWPKTDAALDPPGRRRHVAAAGDREGALMHFHYRWQASRDTWLTIDPPEMTNQRLLHEVNEHGKQGSKSCYGGSSLVGVWRHNGPRHRLHW